jgi:hypothetical protein
MRIDQWMREHRSIIRRASCTTLWGEALSEAIDDVLGAPVVVDSEDSPLAVTPKGGGVTSPLTSPLASPLMTSSSSPSSLMTSSPPPTVLSPGLGGGLDGSGRRHASEEKSGIGGGAVSAAGGDTDGGSAEVTGGSEQAMGTPGGGYGAVGAGRAWLELSGQLEKQGGTLAGLAASITCPHRTRAGLKAYLHQPPQLKLPVSRPPVGPPSMASAAGESGHYRRRRSSGRVRPNLVTCSICLEDLPINSMEACVFWGCGHYICHADFKLLMGTEPLDGTHKCPICRRPILQNAGTWVCSQDNEGRTVFYNTRTNTRTLVRPMESDAHWSDEVEHDAKGKAFYFNRLTGEMAYTNPRA